MPEQQPIAIVVSTAFADRVRALVAQHGLAATILTIAEDGTTADDLSQARVLLRASMSRSAFEQVMAHAPALRWIQAGSAGVEHMLDQRLVERNILLSNAAGVHALPIAEWVLFVMLAIVKQGRSMFEAQQQQRWADDLMLTELVGKTVTIFGAGGIGRAVAGRARAFGMRVWGVNRSGRAVADMDRLWSGPSWQAALPETDMLVIAAPSTPATHHAIGATELARLPQTAWVINVARGALIDEAALLAALRHGAIAGAALDTFEQEPLPADHPFWQMSNVIVSPHNSGASPHMDDRIAALFVENLSRFIRHDPLRNVVDLAQGY